MIVSEDRNRTNSRRLQMCVVLLCALVVLPLGIASAQDYEAVGRRLRAAVAAGELTGEQARTMMEALRKAGAAGENQGADRAKAYLMKVKKDLAEDVEAGRISREDAAKRYEAAEKGIRERMAAGRRQREGQRRRITREDYARAEARLRQGVAEGKISAEDARARLQGMRKMVAGQAERDERRITVEQYKRAEEKMRKMVDEGKAKPEDVERRLIQMRKMMGDQSKRGGERGDRERPDWEAIKRRIEGAVKSGKMTREQADAKYREIRERMAREDRGGDKRVEYEGIERRIKEAVKAGTMTPEQAREKLQAYRKRMGREK